MDDMQEPSQVAKETAGGFEGFMLGTNNCGTTVSGKTETASFFAYFYLLLMLLGVGGKAISCLQADCARNDDKWKHTLMGVVGVAVGALNCYIFYQNATKCSAWRGFFITFALSIAFVAIGARVSPACQSSIVGQIPVIANNIGWQLFGVNGHSGSSVSESI